MAVTIYHNPRCGTSRAVLALIRQSGQEPEIIDYLKTPPSFERLKELVDLMGICPRELIRTKEALYRELGLADENVSDDALLEAMARHPILIDRPIVVTERGARLCRPAETVHDILSARDKS